MANDNQNQAGGEGRQTDLDQQKKDETGQQGQQPQTGGEPTIGGQQGQQSEFGQQGQAGTATAEPSAQPGETGAGQKAASSAPSARNRANICRKAKPSRPALPSRARARSTTPRAVMSTVTASAAPIARPTSKAAATTANNRPMERRATARGAALVFQAASLARNAVSRSIHWAKLGRARIRST